MTATVAHFIDGPWHGAHAELPSPVPSYHALKPRGLSDLLARRNYDPELEDKTYVTGQYDRDKTPIIESERVAVWNYRWGGWQ